MGFVTGSDEAEAVSGISPVTGVVSVCVFGEFTRLGVKLMQVTGWALQVH